ncbi:hypothetical protein COU80_04240 [Candidatus Peregrinibacteria bacterium CG10_big_fil_rev_8_21_14_0_10_55_24]|nr:MAG: hypothetical protein COU80_04240 [Candidatus Peregrinibacteria bacterium CG10_big_fil_rev_8_21_14_0_10_55_24]
MYRTLKVSAVLTLLMSPLAASAYTYDQFSGDPMEQYSSEELSEEQILDAQCREELGLPEADIPYGALKFNLRRCITLKRKAQFNEILGERRRARTQSTYEKIIAPKSEELKRRTASFFRRAVQQQQTSRQNAITESATEQRSSLLRVRAQNRTSVHQNERQQILDARELQSLRIKAREDCLSAPRAERSACIREKLESLSKESQE